MILDVIFPPYMFILPILFGLLILGAIAGIIVLIVHLVRQNKKKFAEQIGSADKPKE